MPGGDPPGWTNTAPCQDGAGWLQTPRIPKGGSVQPVLEAVTSSILGCRRHEHAVAGAAAAQRAGSRPRGSARRSTSARPATGPAGASSVWMCNINAGSRTLDGGPQFLNMTIPQSVSGACSSSGRRQLGSWLYGSMGHAGDVVKGLTTFAGSRGAAGLAPAAAAPTAAGAARRGGGQPDAGSSALDAWHQVLKGFTK